MPDIFVSHKAEQAGVAGRLAKRLTELGYDVWSAAELVAGEHFETEITARLDASRAVVVLWSKAAIGSEWVRAEAEAARRRGIAIPAVIDDLPLDALPLLFRNMHVSNLADWQGGKTHAGYRQLIAAIEDLIGRGKPGPEGENPAREADIAPGPEPVDENELWDQISQNPHPNADEYHSYLKRFGEGGRYAELARLRIKRLEREAAHKRWNWGYVGSALFALATIVGSVIAFVQWASDNPESLQWASSLLVTEEQRKAQLACTGWFDTPAIDWLTSIPQAGLEAIAECEKAAAGFGVAPDIKAMLALAYMARDGSNDEKAKPLAEEAARQGSTIGIFAQGLMHLYGWVYQADTGRAARYLKQAADRGYARADGVLCQVGLDMRGALPTLSEPARSFCQRGSDRGDPSAQRGLGYLYVNGFVGARNPAEARQLFERSAAQGDTVAQYQLGLMELYGAGAPADYAAAARHFDTAARQGYYAATRQLAVMHECGLGFPVDIVQAAQLYDIAFVAGDNVAAYLTGSFLAPGRSSEFGPEAQDTLDLSQIPDCEAANRLMAMRMIFGFNTAVNVPAALDLLTAGANSGNALTQFVLGAIHNQGGIVPRNVDESFRWQQKAAESGIIQGLMALGNCYQFGIGTDIDIEKAIGYFRKAEAQGMPAAADRLRQLGR